jgi:ATP-binding cassette, subfamily F, member 3
LSGGEKARVALAKTILSKANFLLLDEPTNHLDIHSTELLVDALNRYGGSYILVSHDRYFISKTANKIWEIVDHEIKEFKGGYEEYVEWKERMSARKPEGSDNKSEGGRQKAQSAPRKEEVKMVEKPAVSPSATPAKTVSEHDKTALKKELQKQQKVFQQLEKKIAELAQKKEELELMLTKREIYADKDAFKKTESGYKDAVAKLEAANKEYEKVFEKIIDLDEQLLA